MEEVIKLKENSPDITAPEDVFKNIKEININYEQENLIIICLNTKNKIVKTEVLFKGAVDSCIIDQKLLFRFALRQNCNKIIIAHNHPSESLNPSDEDKDVFKRLKDIGDKLDLKVLDSVIFNKTKFYSLNNEE